ncbi:invasion associated locus B family protein [Roseovarius aestuarii]|nr:invasion associated locus B family protein [Roseovarius aestuarii]
MTLMRIFPTLAALALTGTFAIPLSAQDAPKPSRTTATYGDWTVECYTPDPVEGQEAAPAQRCEMQSKVHMKVEDGTSRLIMQMAIGPEGVESDYWIVFQTPLNVLLREEVKLILNAPDGVDVELPEPLLSAAYLYCEPTRCLTQDEMTTEQMNALTETENTKIRFVGRLGREFILPLSMNGFADARAALNG